MHNRLNVHESRCNCPACEAAWAEYWAREREAERLLTQSVDALPATDEEWKRYLDAEFPRVDATQPPSG